MENNGWHIPGREVPGVRSQFFKFNSRDINDVAPIFGYHNTLVTGSESPIEQNVFNLYDDEEYGMWEFPQMWVNNIFIAKSHAIYARGGLDTFRFRNNIYDSLTAYPVKIQNYGQNSFDTWKNFQSFDSSAHIESPVFKNDEFELSQDSVGFQQAIYIPGFNNAWPYFNKPHIGAFQNGICEK